MKIYLVGSVPKGDKEAKSFVNWREQYAQILSAVIDNVEFFDPRVFTRLETDALGLTGADCDYIKQSDLIVVNAEAQIGAGTAMELVIAKYFKKPVITVLPKDTYHRRSNVQFEGRLIADWVHPFIKTFSDFVIADIREIKHVIPKLNKTQIKSIKVIDAAINYARQLLGKKGKY